MKEVLGLELEITYFDVAERAKDITSGCLRFVINKALTDKYGDSWVQIYKSDFNGQNNKSNDKIHANIKTIQDFDFQACLKMFVYMYDKYGSVVLSKYHLTQSKDTIVKLAKELIPFRNKTAHRSDSKKSIVTEPEYEQGILNMRTLVSFFPDVYDNKTKVTYKSQIEQIYFEYKKRQNTKVCYFSDYKEFNGISDEKLLMACTKLSIPHDYDVDDNGNKKLRFYSFEEKKDIKRILLAIDDKSTQQNTYQNGYSQGFTPPKENYDSINKNKKKKSKLFYIVPVIILIIALALIISGIAGAVKFSNEDAKEASIEQSQRSDMVNDIINEASRQVSEHQADSYENTTESTTSSTTKTAKSSSNSSTNQIPDEFKTKFEASNYDWQEDISVGQTNLNSSVDSLSKIWKNVRGYSEDTSIATVGDDLIVTAKAKGVVKILYVGEFMNKEEMYIVEYTVR